MPDLDSLLQLSKLYGLTINEILEPAIPPLRISDFEQIPMMPVEELRQILKVFNADSLAIALMGASPETNHFFAKLFPSIDFENIQSQIGSIQLNKVEDKQQEILSFINLSEQH